MKLQVLLRQIWTTDDATAAQAAPGWEVAPLPTDAPAYAPLNPEIVTSGLSWAEAERLHNELKETVPGQRLYGIGADPAQPGAWRIVKRNY